MPQIFHRSTNTLSKVSIFGAIFIIAAGLCVLGLLNRSPYMTQVGVTRDQPVPFSHEHHVRGLGIDCRYCHTSVENSSFAGIPPTRTCMTCHSQVWTDAPILEPVRESFRSGTPIEWVRVHDLPDFVFFDHSIHINKGVSCVTCHGPVETMALTWRQESLNMEWCLQCHRKPELYVGPKEAVFLPEGEGRRMLAELAGSDDSGKLRLARLRLTEDYRVQRKTDCSVCHR